MAQQVLQVLLVILAQPAPKVSQKGLMGTLVAVSRLLWTVIRLDVHTKVEHKVMKMSILLLQFLVQWIPSAFDEFSGQNPFVTKVQLSLSADTRSPSILTDMSKYDSPETDTLTFIFMPSDDDDLSDPVQTALPP